MSFKNKVVLVTGAGSGIGQAIAQYFAKLSANLSLMDVNAENLHKTAVKCEEIGNSKALKIAIDLTKDEDVKEAVQKTVEVYGRIDVVVNCIGFITMSSILDGDFVKDFDKVMNVNLRSYVIMTYYVAPILVKTQGCIVNISSVCAKMVDKKCIPYNTSKAAVSHFTRNTALELADKGVRVNSVSPGFVKTNILANSNIPGETITGMKAKVPPLNHRLDVDQVAELVGYLASDKAKSITGADFVIDSGYTLLGSLLDEVEES